MVHSSSEHPSSHRSTIPGAAAVGAADAAAVATAATGAKRIAAAGTLSAHTALTADYTVRSRATHRLQHTF
jgi:hypothetical protein